VYKYESWPVLENVKTALASGSPDQLSRLVTLVSPGIYAFDLLPVSFCEDLILEVEHFQNWCDKEKIVIARPNTMNRYGAILDQFGFSPVLDDVTDKIVSPLSSLLYPYIHAAGSLDSHHGFVVEYQQGKDTKLDFHVDSCDVTLNLCLGRRFEGGNLLFKGVRCKAHVNTPSAVGEDFEFMHKPGQAILHVGKHRHLAKRIISGHRMNLILWCRNSGFSERALKRGASTAFTSACTHTSWCWFGKKFEETPPDKDTEVKRDD